ncbi:MAG TPA: ketopantoate reductase family protein [Usitatibacter sp.]|nr:ketopantoate reductase family protein [Usitatibacter sp.]
MRILVLGAGGIGGYFGGRLVQAGCDVTFLVRPRRREQIAADGLRIESPLGNAVVAARTVVAGEVRPGYDLVLFTCKAYDLASAMDAVAPAMQGGCTLLPLLNGLAHFEALDARFGRANVLGGTAHINVTLRGDGVIVHGDPLQRIVYGERGGGRSPRVESMAAAFSRSNLDAKLSEDVEQDLWEKIVFLCALAATTCLFRANVREINAAPGGTEAMERAYAANAEIMRHEGREPRAAAMKAARERLTDRNGLWSASMLRDLEAGRPVEADHIVGWMLERARRHGVDDAILSMAYTHLKAYEARRESRDT